MGVPVTSSDIIAVCAGVVALLAMFATFWQATLARSHNRLSVKPHIDWSSDHQYGKPLTLVLTNHGLGPAIVELLEYQINGITCAITHSKLPPIMADLLSQLPIPCTWTTLTPGTPISPNQSVNLFVLDPDPKLLGEHEAADKFVQSINFSLKYRSIYGELFTISRMDAAKKA